MARTKATLPESPPAVQTEYRFAPIPEAVLYDHGLDPLAVRVYAVLMRHGLDPGSCYPSHRRIGELIGCSTRSVARPLRTLEEAGWITRVPRLTAAGDPDSNGYFVHVQRASQRGVRAEERGPSALASGEGYALASAPKESNGEREPENETLFGAPQAEDNAVDYGGPFDAFWQAYPRKDDKGAARKAFDRIARASSMAGWPSLAEAIAAGAARYAADPNREARYTKLPATWLNAEGWLNGPLPDRCGPPGQRRPTEDRDGPNEVVDVKARARAEGWA